MSNKKKRRKKKFINTLKKIFLFQISKLHDKQIKNLCRVKILYLCQKIRNHGLLVNQLNRSLCWAINYPFRSTNHQQECTMKATEIVHDRCVSRELSKSCRFVNFLLKLSTILFTFDTYREHRLEYKRSRDRAFAGRQLGCGCMHQQMEDRCSSLVIFSHEWYTTDDRKVLAKRNRDLKYFLVMFEF